MLPTNYDENGGRFLSFTPPVLRTWILASIRDILDWRVAWPLISPWLQISSDSHVMQKVFSAGIHSQEFHGTQDVFNGIVFTVALMWTDLEDPSPLTLEYLEGGKARNFWEIFHVTTRNITPPHMFFGLPKEVGGGSSGALNSTRTWRDHYKPEIFSWNISRCGGGTPPFLKYFSF